MPIKKPPKDTVTGKGLKGTVPRLRLVRGTLQKPPELAKRSAPNPITGLTEKQELFCRKIVEGFSQADAYRFAYDCRNMKDGTIYRHSSVALATNEKIRKRITDLQVEKERAALHDAAQTRTFVLQRLRHEAENGDTSTARIRAAELLGKLDTVGMFRDRVASESIDRSPDEIAEELEKKLAEYLKA